MAITLGQLDLLIRAAEGDNHYPEVNQLNLAITAGLFGGKVLDKDLTAPPMGVDQALYIVATGGSGDWTGEDGNLAVYDGGAAAWQFIPAREGMFVWVADEDELYHYTGSAWAIFSSGGTGTETGTGSPEGVVTAAVGTIYVQTDASPASDGLWYKQTGAGDTGWEQVTASDGSGGGGAFSGARVFHSTTQSITTSGVEQALTFNSETFDTDGYHAGGAPTRLTAPTTGKYLVYGGWNSATNGTGFRRTRIRQDGTTIIAGADTATANAVSSTFAPVVTTVASLTAGQYVELMATQTSGGSLNANGGDGVTWFAMHLIADTANSMAETIMLAASDETTELTSGTGKLTFRMPFAMTLTAIPRASLTTASSSGAVTVDINETGTGTILSTKLTIDEGEKTSTTAAVPAVLSDAALADDAEITIDIDGAGADATGLKVTLIGNRA